MCASYGRGEADAILGGRIVSLIRELRARGEGVKCVRYLDVDANGGFSATVIINGETKTVRGRFHVATLVELDPL